MTRGARVPVSTHLAAVSGMLVSAGEVEIVAVAQSVAARAVALSGAQFVAVVLETDNGAGLMEVVAFANADDLSVPEAITIAVASSTVSYGAVLLIDDSTHPPMLWAELSSVASDLGIRSVRGYPIRYDGRAVGALVLASVNAWAADGAEPPVARDASGVQVLVDLTGIALNLARAPLERVRAARNVDLRMEDQAAFEQAQGILAERHSLSLDTAAELVHSCAIRLRQPIATIARRIVGGESFEDLDNS